MKICTKCNHAVSDGELACPYCGSTELETADSGSTLFDKLRAEDDGNPVSGEIEAALEAVDAEIDTELSDNFDFPPLPEDFDGLAAPAAEEAPAPEDGGQEPSGEKAETDPRHGGENENENKDKEQKVSRSSEIIAGLNGGLSAEPGVLEQKIKKLEKEQGAQDDTAAAPSKLGIVLLAVLIATVLALTVVSLVRYMRTPADEDSRLLLEYMCGTWKSDPYVYSDDLSHGYVEVLQVNSDGTFELTHLIPDPRNENGYEDGSWPTDSILSGTVEIYAEDKCVVFKYTEFGQGYYFDRYIVRMEDDKMAMREYYDDDKTQSFDIVFTRVDTAADLTDLTDENTDSTDVTDSIDSQGEQNTADTTSAA